MELLWEENLKVRESPKLNLTDLVNTIVTVTIWIYAYTTDMPVLHQSGIMWLGQQKGSKWAHKIWPTFSTFLHHSKRYKYVYSIDMIFYHQWTTTFYNLQNVNILYRTQDIKVFMMACSLCQLGPLSLAQLR